MMRLITLNKTRNHNQQPKAHKKIESSSAGSDFTGVVARIPFPTGLGTVAVDVLCCGGSGTQVDEGIPGGGGVIGVIGVGAGVIGTSSSGTDSGGGGGGNVSGLSTPGTFHD